MEEKLSHGVIRSAARNKLGGHHDGRLDGSLKARSMLKGMRLRDEFLCPILYELFRDPVVASDGHTYERDAIEKWLSSGKTTSPRNGQPISNTITANLNMKKLMQDLIAEGGIGLYCNDIAGRGRMIEVLPEKTLVVACLGPAESDWNGRSFQVKSSGCIGGRGNLMEDATQGRDVVQFKDIDISRRHFEIAIIKDPAIDNSSHVSYGIRDLGSIGGTFIRLLFGQRKELHPGMIVLIGQHQFTVSSIMDTSSSYSSSKHFSDCEPDNDNIHNNNNDRHGSAEAHEVASMISNDADALMSKIRMSLPGSIYQQEVLAFESRIKALTDKLNSPASNNSSCINSSNIMKKGEAKDESSSPRSIYSRKLCILTCFQPEGSPILGSSFTIGSQGGTIGRRPTSDIGVYLKTVNEDGEAKHSGIDGAVSADHARIIMNPATGQFYIHDGTERKPSTNGVWWRLSGPHQESSYYSLRPNDEFLVGKSRFQVSESMSILEREIDSTANEK